MRMPYYVWVASVHYWTRTLKDKIMRDVAGWFPRSFRHSRLGTCMRCGACCRIVFRCPFYVEHGDGTGHCRIYAFRPLPCRQYPRHPRDLLSVRMCSFVFRNDTPREKNNIERRDHRSAMGGRG